MPLHSGTRGYASQDLHEHRALSFPTVITGSPFHELPGNETVGKPLCPINTPSEPHRARQGVTQLLKPMAKEPGST